MAMPPAPTASFGNIDEFGPATASWDIYCERLHHCFTVRNIDENTTEIKETVRFCLAKLVRPLIRYSEICARPANREIKHSLN